MATDYSKTLYKLDTSGKERFITYEAINGELVQASGVVGSENIVVNRRVCKPKNVGRSNETTIEEQAVLEAKSKIRDKLAKEYFETLEEAHNTVVVLPMLAKTYDKKYIKDAKILYVQRKYDGYRCIAHVKDGQVKLMSRSNKDILVTKKNSMKHIAEQMSKFPDGVYDGELFNLELGSFQEQTKAINKYREGISEKINYNIYDLLSCGAYHTRLNLINHRINTCKQLNIVKVPTSVIASDINHNFKTFKLKHDQYVKEGYEGAIIRVDNCTYQMNKRSSQLLKMKLFFDINAEITKIVPQDSDPTKGQPVCKSLEAIHGIKLGAEFRAGLAIPHTDQVYMLNHPKEFIGKVCNIRFFEATDEGKPRHPTYHGLKDI